MMPRRVAQPKPRLAGGTSLRLELRALCRKDTDFGFRLMTRFRDEFRLEAKIEKDASFEGKRLTMLIAPLAADIKKKLQREAELQQQKAEEEASKGRRVISLEESKQKASAESAPLQATADPAKAK